MIKNGTNEETMTHIDIPTIEIAKEKIEEWAKKSVTSIKRFTTGNHHYVYDAVFSDGSKSVIRMTTPNEKQAMIGASEWNSKLRQMGIPVAQKLFSDLDFIFPYLILERLPGTDLSFTIDQMSESDLKFLAMQLMEFQKKVGFLPTSDRFGYSASHLTAKKHSWMDVIEEIIDRSKKRIIETGFVDTSNITKVLRFFDQSKSMLNINRPVAFLHDITTKNVIIHQGKLSGIVDVDDLCFGDPLFHIGLTQMAVLSQKSNMKYIEHLINQYGSHSADLLRLYTAICCLAFLSELGQEFNGNKIEATYDHRNYLESVLNNLV